MLWKCEFLGCSFCKLTQAERAQLIVKFHYKQTCNENLPRCLCSHTFSQLSNFLQEGHTLYAQCLLSVTDYVELLQSTPNSSGYAQRRLYLRKQLVTKRAALAYARSRKMFLMQKASIEQKQCKVIFTLVFFSRFWAFCGKIWCVWWSVKAFLKPGSDSKNWSLGQLKTVV